MISEQDRKEEAILDARIMLGKAVDHPNSGWQQRYSESVDRVAVNCSVPVDELVRAFMSHYGPSFLAHEDNLNE